MIKPSFISKSTKLIREVTAKFFMNEMIVQVDIFNRIFRTTGTTDRKIKVFDGNIYMLNPLDKTWQPCSDEIQALYQQWRNQ